MSTIIQYEGVLSQVNTETDTVTEMYPVIKTDSTLSVEGKAADAAKVGDELKKVLYIDSFDSSTGTLNTKSADYNG